MALAVCEVYFFVPQDMNFISLRRTNHVIKSKNITHEIELSLKYLYTAKTKHF